MQFRSNADALRSDLRISIEALLPLYPSGITTTFVTDHLGARRKSVQGVLNRLVTHGLVISTAPGRPNTKYIWKTEMTVIAPPNCVNKMSGTYDGKELKPFDGRPNCNQHLQHPSVIGGKRVYKASNA